MEKVWQKEYQAGVPYEIDPNLYSSVNEAFETACKRYADRPAFANMGTSLTFAEVEEQSRAFAAFLKTKLGVEKGTRIALMLPNLLQYPVALFGALRAGLVVVTINPLYTPRELEFQLKDSGCELIVILANFAYNLEQILDKTTIKHIIVTEIGDLFPPIKASLVNWMVKYVKGLVPDFHFKRFITFKEVLRVGKTFKFEKTDVSPEDIAFLQYTGGTTGTAKAAILTHRNIVANIMQTTSWIMSYVTLGKEIIITALPLYHIFSLLANGLAFMYLGALNVLITNPRDTENFVKTLKQYPFTAITGVNTLFNALLNQKAFAKLNFSNLRLSLGGGMAVQRSVAERWKTVTGVVLLEAYGLTEASPAVCINPINIPEYNGTVGLPIPSTDIAIRDEAGKELSFNEEGELWVKGPQVTHGYWHRPFETETLLKDGWLATGDIAVVDEKGYVRLVDRKKDIIVVSGFNVYPNEVEDVIAMLAGVKEVAVVGLPAGESGEKVKAFVVKKDPSLTVDAILQHCRRQLTGYKIPKEIEFRTELPKTNVGKILRRTLKPKT